MPFDASPQFLPQSPSPSRTGTDPVLRVLTQARASLAGGWCRGALARDGDGRAVAFASPAARAFCLAGAVYRAGLDEQRGTMGALLLLMQCAEPLTVADCNDRLLVGRGDAVAFFDRVIETRRAELAAASTPTNAPARLAA